jgi:hypothetical protein
VDNRVQEPWNLPSELNPYIIWGHTATKPDKVDIGITKNFRDQVKRLLITKNRVVYIPRKFFRFIL